MVYSTRKLQHRLVMYVALGQLIFSILMGIVTYQYAYHHQLYMSNNLASQLVQTIKSQAEIAVFVNNYEIGREILNGLLTSPIIIGARIESTDLFKLEQTSELSNLEVDFTQGNIYPLFSPVDGKELIGSVTVVLNNRYIRSEASQASLIQTVIMLIQFLMATILIVWVSRRVISQPVSDLTKAVIAVRPGKNAHLDIKQIHAQDEIGLLSNSINSLIDAAEVAIAESTAARTSAEAANRSKSEFLANMSHEIRTPMNAIMGFADIVLKTEMSPPQKDYISKIQSASNSLLGVINDILDFSKIEAGKLKMESIEFRLDEVINNTATMVSIKAAEKGIELVSKLSDDVPVYLVGDPLRLGQILINLANNAVKFTENGHIFIKAELLHINRDPDNKIPTGTNQDFPSTSYNNTLTQTDGDRCMIRFSVSDTGIGMNEEQISNLFEAFAQADSSVTRRFGGTGLGLAISKRLVQMLGGEIVVKSEINKGSTFSFTAGFTIGPNIEKKDFILPENLVNRKVLIVDDNMISREVMTNQLVSTGFETVAVDSGQVALLELGRSTSIKPYDLVLVDWKMPDMDGIELSRSIRQDSDLKKIPIIIMVTPFGSENIVQLADEVGINSVLIKPVIPSIMFNSIMHVFRTPTSDTEKHMTSLNSQPATDITKIVGARILLVEDNLINQQVATEILQGINLVVDVANNGQEAVNHVKNNNFDLVLMDIQMPVMGGYEATGIIKADRRFKNLPIIAMTAHAMSGARESCLEAGMDDYIAKPIDQMELCTVLTKWIKPRAINNLQPIKKKSQISKDKQYNTQAGSENIDINLPKNLPGVDISSALKRLNGNKKLYWQLLTDFAKNYESVIEKIQNALSHDDLDTAEHLSHTIKGVGGNLSADAVYRAAQKLEYAIARKEDNYDILLSQLNQAMVPLLTEIVNLIRQDLKKEDQRDLPVDTEMAIPVVIQLAGFLKANDANALPTFDTFKEIMKGSIFREDIGELETSIDNFDFASALISLEKIADTLNISIK